MTSTPPTPPRTPPSFAERVNSNVRAELARRKISTQGAAAMIDKSSETVRRRLAGQQEWPLGDLDLLARRLDIDPEVFAAA